MTNEWGNEWPKAKGVAIAKHQWSSSDADINTQWPKAPVPGWQTEFKPQDGAAQKELKSQGSNLVDNQGYLYLKCEKCDKLLNPHTKSYLMLQDWRVSAGWKCIWNVNGVGYKVYCEGCKV